MAFRHDIKITAVIGLFVVLSLSFLSFSDVWWDSAVFIGQGKYIYSSGQSGLWEPARPLALPLLLGLIRRLNLDEIIFGTIFMMLLGAGCVYLTYLIGKEAFNEKTALIASLFLASSPTFFFFSSRILEGIPSAFFSLLAVHLFLKKRYFPAGLFSGAAFMARFPQFIVFMALAAILVSGHKKGKSLQKNFLAVLAGFFLVTMPYLVSNYIMYGSVLYPFLLQKFLTQYTGGAWHEPWYFYFFGLLKENILSLFSILGIILILNRIEAKKAAVLFPFLALFAFFTFIDVKVIRYAIVFLPFLYLLSSHGIFVTYRMIKSKRQVFLSMVFFVWLAQTAYNAAYAYDGGPAAGSHKVFQDYIDQAQNPIWITNPVYAVYSDKSIDELMYYPTFNHEKFLSLKENIGTANAVLMNTCDLYCEPYNSGCEKDKEELIQIFKSSFIVNFEEIGECSKYIFSK